MKAIDQNFKFVIVGGGTAGWLTALFLRDRFRLSKITLIESSKLGILGAGEGTTPTFCILLRQLGIPFEDLFKHADATFKIAIKYTNWNNDGKHYYHGFQTSNQDANYSKFITLSDYNLFALDAVRRNITVGELNLTNILSKSKLSPFDRDYNYVDRGHAMHYNANKLAAYLKTVGLKRNIEVIDDVVKTPLTNEEGEITALQCEQNLVNCDFVFDCSGFSRLLIGQHFKSEWQSYADIIPNDSGLPFFLPCNKNIPPYTECIAMDNGWVWKIPTNGRYGCGYVFSSRHIDVDSVRKEIIDKFGDVEFPRSEPFSFKSGTYKQTWIKNCIALGLSTGFIEPLEATSIMTSVNSLFILNKTFRGITRKCQTSINEYNHHVHLINRDILEFVFLHYLTKRNNTEYWRHFHKVDCQKEGLHVVDFIKKLDGQVPSLLQLLEYTRFPYFAYMSWLEVPSGLGLFDVDKANDMFESSVVGTNYNEYRYELNQYKLGVFKAVQNSIEHDKIIDYLVKHE